MNFKTIAITGATLLVLATLSSCAGVEIVDTGHRGVKTHYGKPDPISLEEGLYFYNPLTSSIIEMDTRTQTLSQTEMAYTKDVQQAQIGYTVNFNLQKDKVHLMYQEVGRNWQEILVPQIVKGALKNVIGKWEAVDLIANRDKATRAIEDAVKTELAEKYVTVTKVEITGIDYHDNFEKAVEDKVTAIQRASESQNKTVQVEEEAKQKVIAAKAEAESMKIRSEALSQNKSLVEYEAVQKWNGVLPQYVLGGSVPFVNVTPATK